MNTTENRKKRYLALRTFLTSYEPIWSTEVIHDVANGLEHYPETWVAHILQLNEEELFILSNSASLLEKLPPDFNQFLNSIQSLTLLPDFFKNRIDFEKAENILPPPAYQNLTPKKKHEINRVFHFLKSQNSLPSQSEVIDFCGGAGYIARTLSHFFDTPSLSVDFDIALQKRGAHRTTSFIPKQKKEIQFKNLDLLSEFKKIKLEFKDASPFLGIHTCAHLSDVQLRLSKELSSHWTLNVGCCYFKTRDSTYQLSDFAKNNPMHYTTFSLFLAARGHETLLETFLISQKVKKYRFLLHLFLRDNFDIDFTPVGSIPIHAYKTSFEEYALSRLAYLKEENIIPIIPSRSSLEKFSNDASIIRTIKRMLACNFIRSHFSRPLELSIALDRAIFLDENNFEVAIGTLFDPTISPRNIGLFGKRKSI
jgi:hypothetical protein